MEIPAESQNAPVILRNNSSTDATVDTAREWFSRITPCFDWIWADDSQSKYRCIPGYEYNSQGVCVQICGWGEISDGNGGCTPCQEPLIPDYNGVSCGRRAKTVILLVY